MPKAKTKTYTTTELASICSVSVASISAYIKKHKLKQVKTGNYNAKYYSDNVLQQLKEHYKNKPKSSLKRQQTTKDDVIEQLEARIKEQSSTIEVLKEQLDVKDEQIATANRIADQAQQLDLTTHKQQEELPVKSNELTDGELETHNWLWKLFH